MASCLYGLPPRPQSASQSASLACKLSNFHQMYSSIPSLREIQIHFQQKAKLIFYLYYRNYNYNLLFAKLLSKLFINVLLNYSNSGWCKVYSFVKVFFFVFLQFLRYTRRNKFPPLLVLQFYCKHKTVCSGKLKETTRWSRPEHSVDAWCKQHSPERW